MVLEKNENVNLCNWSEELFANESIQRFSKNIKVSKRQPSGYIVTEQTDVDFL